MPCWASFKPGLRKGSWPTNITNSCSSTGQRRTLNSPTFGSHEKILVVARTITALMQRSNSWSTARQSTRREQKRIQNTTRMNTTALGHNSDVINLTNDMHHITKLQCIPRRWHKYTDFPYCDEIGWVAFSDSYSGTMIGTFLHYKHNVCMFVLRLRSYWH